MEYQFTLLLFPTDGMNRPMLAVHPTKDLLDKLDNIPNIPQMTVVPWIGKEIQDWIDLRSAVMLPDIDYNPISAGENKQPLDRIVTAALEDLSERVDLNRMVWENDVKFGSIILFRILVNNGIDYDPESIKEYLLTKFKWNPLAADQAAQVADRIRSGNTYELFKDIPEPWNSKFWKNDYDNALYEWRMKAKDLK